MIVTLCAAAVREWLVERDALPGDPLVALVPVSVRRREERGAFGNRISAMTVPIPTDEPDPLARLARAARAAAGREGDPPRPAGHAADRRHELHPAGGRVARRAHDGRRAEPHAAAGEPGDLERPRPREPLYLAGARLERTFPVSVIVDGVGLNITVLSYLDQIDVGIVADREQMDDLWSLLAGMERALDELEGAVAAAA